jgi:RNA polymerase sigma factor (sigma-70 family)
MSWDGTATVPEPGSDDSGGERVGQPRRIGAEHARRVRQCFEESYPQIVHWLAGRIGSVAVAHDIVDQAFAKVLEIERPEAVENIRAYVYKTAANLASRKAEAAALRRRIHQAIADEPPQFTPSPEPAIVAEQRLRTLWRAIEALQPRVRMAIKLRFWDELPYAEIAVRFREKGVVVNERTIKRWVAYGLECCRQEIEVHEGKGDR